MPASNPRDNVTRQIFPWLSFPFLVALCPDEPLAVDLVQPTKRNPLANFIRIFTSQIGLDSIQQLAFGWLLYTYTKWRSDPTEYRFMRLPHCLHPTRDQMQSRHATAIDVLPWPMLRNVLIEVASGSNITALLRSLLTSVRHNCNQSSQVIADGAPTFASPKDLHRGYGCLNDWDFDLAVLSQLGVGFGGAHSC